MNKINENINTKKTFNLFYKTLGNRIGIILLLNKDRKNCLDEIKELFMFLYDNLIEDFIKLILNKNFLLNFFKIKISDIYRII